MTIELDYAFLADYAVVADGKLTAVGASFTIVKPPSLPQNLPISIAGRLRASVGTTAAGLKIEVVPPNKEYEINAEGVMHDLEGVQPYDGKLGLLFAFTLALPLVAPGLYVVNLYLEGNLARRLAFEVEV